MEVVVVDDEVVDRLPRASMHDGQLHLPAPLRSNGLHGPNLPPGDSPPVGVCRRCFERLNFVRRGCVSPRHGKKLNLHERSKALLGLPCTSISQPIPTSIQPVLPNHLEPASQTTSKHQPPLPSPASEVPALRAVLRGADSNYLGSTTEGSPANCCPCQPSTRRGSATSGSPYGAYPGH